MTAGSFFLPAGAPQRGAARHAPYKRLGRQPKTLAQAGSTPAEHVEPQEGAHKRQRLLWDSKKKMRSLGTVQIPTEAFMAVLKLDEE